MLNKEMKNIRVLIETEKLKVLALQIIVTKIFCYKIMLASSCSQNLDSRD